MAKAKTATKAKTPGKSSKSSTGRSHPGMMGDGTEEQNLGQKGKPKARIGQAEVKAAFGKPAARAKKKK